ncbi:MAG: TatD family hydrolase [Thiomicrospira sp.]|uniref:TatD family hydrolase n=1 Tax=Thiomicrospira sp. TaxID=935 RepID=UPI0019E2FDF3|nr:TatD family hydrolase [Thiomicrospira sp.]MBE0492757.1 TatD family hydrolase [Thiomicrospira sp.]
MSVFLFIVMLIDTHAHLPQLNFSADEIHHPVISVSTDFQSCQSNHTFTINAPNLIFTACGLHPWFVKDTSLDELNLIFGYIQSKNARIMGEMGLDFSDAYKHTRSQQIEVLEAQLSFAYDNDLSVSLHLVKAYDALFDLLVSYPVQGAIHSFPGSLEQANRFSKLGLKIGVNGLILRDNAPRYHNLIKNMPIESLVLETDAPNIAYPDGRQGDLKMLPLIATRISQIKNIDLNNVSEITTNNAIESFKLNELL